MSIDINDIIAKLPPPGDTPSKPERTWLNHLGEIEGYLSLIIVLWLLYDSPQARRTSGYSYPMPSYYFNLQVYMVAFSLGFALGAIRHGYAWGKYIGSFVFVLEGSCVLFYIFLNVYRLVFLEC